jgi:scyllo-inositol 2-dehydrogenase (NADP+)
MRAEGHRRVARNEARNVLKERVMTLSVGLIGYGLGGSVFHAPLIDAVERLSLKAIATTRPLARDDVRVVPVPEALIADRHLDLLVIASPNRSHFPLAKAALLAGKHVVVDKPFTVTQEEADALIALATEQRRVLTVFHNRRWDGDYLTVKQLLGSGTLGKIMLFEAHWDRFRPAIKQGWREVPDLGAGLLNDLGPHLLDQALQLFGAPDAISGDVMAQRTEANVDDYFSLTLCYGQMRAILSASTLVAAARPRFAVHGSLGSFVKYGLDPQATMLEAGARPGAPGFGEEAPEFYGALARPEQEPVSAPTLPGCYGHFYEAVADAILDGAPVPVDPFDAREGLRLIELARQSAAEGRLLSATQRR